MNLTLDDLRARGRDPVALLRAASPLLLDPAWIERLTDGAPLLFWDDEDDGEDLPAPHPYLLTNGIAIVSVLGPIAQRGWMCLPGYDTLAGALEKALADPAAKVVLLRINSPGGAAAGAFEWTRRMRDLVVASGKRCIAYADEMALSGAYAVACVADEIVVPETGSAGSVGVIASMTSRARQNDLEGVDVRVIRAGAEKADGHPDLPLDDAAIAREQATVDRIAGVFHRWVSERRGLAVDAVVALQAGIRMGPEAVASGLADRVQGYHALLASLTPMAPQAPASRLPTGATRATRTTMDETLLAALVAATGETDPAQQASALVALRTRADAAEASLARMTEDHAAALSRAQVAEQRAEGLERDRELEAAKAAGQWTPALDGFLATLSVPQLRAWRSTAPRAVPEGEIKPPSTQPAPDAQLPASVAALVAKAHDVGWKALSADEKHALTRHDKNLAARLRAR